MTYDGWIIDIRHLADTRLGNFICGLRGPAREEAIDSTGG